MPISKRLRYEILRRDNHTCRYCGGVAPDVKLTVDHVTPVALGGSDAPANLVTACKDCNAGKSSSNPDAAIVEDVRQEVLRWNRAMLGAALVLAEQREHRELYLGEFFAVWPQYRHLPNDAESSVLRLHEAGLPAAEMQEAAQIALSARSVHTGRFSYFMGVCWHRVRAMQEIATQMLAAETED